MHRHVALLLLSLSSAGALHAATFNSTLPLKVFERQTSDLPDRVIGFTPANSSVGLKTPTNGRWYVRPVGPLTAELMKQLVEEIRAGRISGVDFSDRWDISNEQLAILQGLPGLRILLLARTRVNDQGIEHIQDLRNLEILSLSRMTTDQGLSKLKNLSRLRDLDLSDSRVSDKGISFLGAFKKLERLALGHAVTDNGILVIATLKPLRQLNLRSTQVTDRGLGPLASLPHLEWLSLSDAVTKEGGLTIAALSSLQTVVVDGTPMPVAVLGHLREMQGFVLSPGNIQPSRITAALPMMVASVPATHVPHPLKKNPFAITVLKDVGGRALSRGAGIRPGGTEQAVLSEVTSATLDPKIALTDESNQDSSIGDINVQISPSRHRTPRTP